jgi:hypothetical protein
MHDDDSNPFSMPVAIQMAEAATYMTKPQPVTRAPRLAAVINAATTVATAAIQSKCMNPSFTGRTAARK